MKLLPLAVAAVLAFSPAVALAKPPILRATGPVLEWNCASYGHYDILRSGVLIAKTTEPFCSQAELRAMIEPCFDDRFIVSTPGVYQVRIGGEKSTSNPTTVE